MERMSSVESKEFEIHVNKLDYWARMDAVATKQFGRGTFEANSLDDELSIPQDILQASAAEKASGQQNSLVS